MTTSEHGESSISERKFEHLSLALGTDSQGPVSPGWDDIQLIHNCLPEMAFREVDLQINFLGQRLAAPLWITGMTGGHERAGKINARLAEAAERYGLAMGLGSQRASLVESGLRSTYQVARAAAPSAVLIANIGAPQLVAQQHCPPLTIEDLEKIVADVGAQGLAIHLNWLQEIVQSEGDRSATGCLESIREIVGHLSVPVMVKETGAGIAREQARALARVGVAALDVGGAGGTSMVRIENGRAGNDDARVRKLNTMLDRWGIPTAASVLEAQGCGVPIVATGGVRSGLDAARALSLGAHMVGVGRPFLVAAEQGRKALDNAIEGFLDELRAALFLCGCRRPEDVRLRRPILSGGLAAWAAQRGLW